jgi:hypothetical protein
MNNFKLTSSNLCAIIIVLSFFMEWVGTAGSSQSGLDLWQLGVSPGFAAMFVKGFTRIFLLLLILIPVAAGLILWQKNTAQPNQDLSQWVRRSFYIPAAISLLCLIVGIIKLNSTKSQIEDSLQGYGGMMKSFAPQFETPGLTDMLGIGAYLTLFAGIFLLLIGIGKVQDKVLYQNKAEVKTSLDEGQE